jgi:hypothetical protein
VSVTLVKEYGETCIGRNLELGLKRLELCVARGEIPKKVEATFANRNNRTLRGQGSNQFLTRGIIIGRVMWMNTRGGVKVPWVCFGERGGRDIALVTGASNDHPCDPGFFSAPHYFVPIFVETVVGQVGADINQGVGHFL